jgi:hypothetical protein
MHTAAVQQLMEIGRNMENKDKIDIISNRIDNLSYHISALSIDIEKFPDEDLEDKPKRLVVLQDFIAKKTALINELQSLTIQG